MFTQVRVSIYSSWLKSGAIMNGYLEMDNHRWMLCRRYVDTRWRQSVVFRKIIYAYLLRDTEHKADISSIKVCLLSCKCKDSFS